VRLYDDGAAAGVEGERSRLDIDCTPSHVATTLVRLEDRDRRLQLASQRSLAPGKVEDLRVDPGYYSLVFTGTGIPETRYPLYVAAGQQIDLHLDLRPTASLAPGEIFIPAGPALIGGDAAAAFLDGEREVQVAAFAIAERPVTVDEYLAFIEATYERDPARADALLPRRPEGVPYWKRRDGAFVPVGISDWGPPEELRKLPVFGVDAISAEAYAAWKSALTGHRYRLPAESEWEKAARGTDGRNYPWGDSFDASFCKMRESRPHATRPEPSGTFEADVSPYGVRDTAGGIADWVLPEGEARRDASGVRLMVTRGGSWCDWEIDCLLYSRRPAWATERAARVGFRLVREI
jgi:serine/threonine-protein kinase